MKHIIIIFLVVLLAATQSCRKMRYNEVTIKGRVMNGTAWLPMPGETVNLIEYSPGGFLLPDKATVIATSFTDANGYFGFPGVELRKNNKYYYRVMFVQHGTTKCCYCEYIDVDKNKQFTNQDIVLVVGGGGLSFEVLPDMSALGSGDSVHVDVSTSIDFSKFYCSTTIEDDLGKFVNFSKNHSSFMYSNPTGAGLSFNAWYYIKTTKYKSGMTYISHDTVYLVSGYNHQINW